MPLIDNGSGVCNLLHCDNLIRVIEHYAAVGMSGVIFANLSDPEEISWRTYLDGLCEVLNVPPLENSISSSQLRPFWLKSLKDLVQTAPAQRLIAAMSGETKLKIKQALTRSRSPMRNLSNDSEFQPSPTITRDLWDLMVATRRPIPWKSDSCPLLSFDEGMRLTRQWMQNAGFAAFRSNSPFNSEEATPFWEMATRA